MKFRYRWKPIGDDEVGRSFAVSPRFSVLVEGADELSSALSLFLGFRKSLRDDALAPVPAYQRCAGAPLEMTISPAEAAQIRSVFAPDQFRGASLIRRVQKAADFGISRSRAVPDLKEAGHMAIAWQSLASGEAGACLPESLCRLSYLVAAGFKPSFVVGIFVPTDTMHAWIEIEDQVLGEHPDTMVHYQSALKFSVGAPH